MNFFHVKTLTETLGIVRNNLPQSVFEAETLPLVFAVGKTLAEDIFAPDLLPPYDRSTVDGFAVSAKETYGASESVPTMLKLVGAISIGEAPTFTLKKGEAAVIATGAVLVDGADGVVMLEHTAVVGDEVAVYSPIKVRENVVVKGEDVAVGEKILQKGETLTPLALGILAGLGVETVKVFKSPKLAIISTGDELVDVCEKSENGKIRDLNTTLLSAYALKYGFELTYKTRVKDDDRALNEAVRNAVSVADIVLISGGSSVGARDYTAKVLEESGALLVHGVALKPGKPTMLARVQNALVFGLAGHPLAAALSFKTLCCDEIRKARGGNVKPLCVARALVNFPSNAGRTTLQLVRTFEDENGVCAEPLFLKSAHIATALKADGYVVLGENCEGVNKGESVKVFPLD